MPSSQKPERAAALEEFVASLYRALGYSVRRDVLLGGNQIDLVAERHVAGIGNVTIAIEVKHRTGPVSKEAVNDFLTVSRLLLQSGNISKAVMVTDSTFTRAGRLAAEGDTRIELLDTRSLGSQLLSVEAPLLRYVNDYEVDLEENPYVDLTVGDTTIDALATTLDKRHHAIFLLADYGAGKTTSLRRIKYLVAKTFLENGTHVIPILFTLRDVHRFARMEDYVLATIHSEVQAEIGADELYRFIDAGRFLFLFDGFDEISTRSDPATRADLLVTLSPYLFGRCSSVLSTRPSYFSTQSEYLEALATALDAPPGGFRPLAYIAPNRPQEERVQALAGQLRLRRRPVELARLKKGRAEPMEIAPLSSEQIDLVLLQYEQEFVHRGLEGASAVRKSIDKVYDLSDLMTRPIILTMIVDTILQGLLLADASVELGPVHLYEAYTQAKLGIDWDKESGRSHAITSAERRSFAIRSALEMYRSGRLDVTFEECTTFAEEILQKRLTTIGVDRALTDFRTCSFLTTTADGALRFVHRSFQEYFVAQHMRECALSNDWSFLAGQTVPSEILYFLGSYVHSSDEFRAAVNDRLAKELDEPTPDAVLRSNLAAAVLSANRRASNLDWKDLTVSGVLGRGLRIERSRLNEVRFLESRLGAVELEDVHGSVRLELDGCAEMDIIASTGDYGLSGSCAAVHVSGSKIRILHERWNAESLRVSDDSLLSVTGTSDLYLPRGLNAKDAGASFGGCRVRSDGIVLLNAGVALDGELGDAADRQAAVLSRARDLLLTRSLLVFSGNVNSAISAEGSLLHLTLAQHAPVVGIEAVDSVIVCNRLDRIRVRGHGNTIIAAVTGSTDVEDWIAPDNEGVLFATAATGRNVGEVRTMKRRPCVVTAGPRRRAAVATLLSTIGSLLLHGEHIVPVGRLIDEARTVDATRLEVVHESARGVEQLAARLLSPVRRLGAARRLDGSTA